MLFLVKTKKKKKKSHLLFILSLLLVVVIVCLLPSQYRQCDHIGLQVDEARCVGSLKSASAHLSLQKVWIMDRKRFNGLLLIV